jgi:hypothetical protein
MPKPSSRQSRIAAEEKRLREIEEDALRKKLELEKRLKVLPAVMEAQEARRREVARDRAKKGGRAISPDRPLGSRAGPARRTLPKRELNSAKLTTVVLLIVLALIVLMLWRAIPTAG